MPNLLKTLYDRLELIKGKKLAALLAGVFVTFLIIGLLIGYVTSFLLNKNEDLNSSENLNTEVVETYYEGKITYVSPALYPQDEISYALTDTNGNEVILLKSRDQKLVVSEGHYVRAYGQVIKTLDGSKDILMVEKVVIKNGSN